MLDQCLRVSGREGLWRMELLAASAAGNDHYQAFG